jgi:diguanylate cyclase (GGDEF)-like protein
MQPQDLLRELKRTVDELQALNDIGRALTSTLDLTEVLRLVMRKVSELTRAGNWSLLLVDEQTGDLVFEVAIGTGSERLFEQRLPRGEGIAGWVVANGQPVLVEDVRADPRFSSRFDAMSGVVTRSVLAVPLAAHGSVLGVIELVNPVEAAPFTPEDLVTLRTVADYAAIAIENAKAYDRIVELTITDDHTGLYNARYLYRSLEHELARGERYKRPFSVVFLDLDKFKQVNDVHGHQAGSQTLREVGAVLKAALRETDVPIRYGGDEYVVVMPETDKERALHVAERLRKTVSETVYLKDRGLAVHVTASFGVATFPEDGKTVEELLAGADAAMYAVKESARDGVTHAGAVRKRAGSGG